MYIHTYTICIYILCMYVYYMSHQSLDFFYMFGSKLFSRKMFVRVSVCVCVCFSPFRFRKPNGKRLKSWWVKRQKIESANQGFLHQLTCIYIYI